MPKHVIFLGAGASATSKYPMARALRHDWLSTSDGLKAQVQKALTNAGVPHSFGQIAHDFEHWIEPIKMPLLLFRKGCFGTIDEFCKLIYDSRGPEVIALKKVLRLVLGIHYPEPYFAESDYYEFIQKLFSSDLHSLRDDIVVISFNYDTYLEWLIDRAYATRRSASAAAPLMMDKGYLNSRDRITAGFSGGQSGQEILKSGVSGFLLLKLHGMIAWPRDVTDAATRSSRAPCVTFENIFNADIVSRLKVLLSPDLGQTDPPIAFPWEVIKPSHGFPQEKDFRIQDANAGDWRAGGRSPNDPSIHSIFKEIWTRARWEVQNADKISFVGLSMHSLLEEGFRYLFANRSKDLDMVITDDSLPVESGQLLSHATNSPKVRGTGPASRLMNMMTRVCPGIRYNGSSMSVKVRKDFADFIEMEMGDGG